MDSLPKRTRNSKGRFETKKTTTDLDLFIEKPPEFNETRIEDEIVKVKRK